MTYPAPPESYYPYPPPRSTNGMAIAALVCAFLFAPLAIVFGHISLAQIKRTGEDGRGLAIAGLVIGYLLTLFAIVTVALTVLIVIIADRKMDDSVYLAEPQTPADFLPAPPAEGQLPEFNPPTGLGANCTYPSTGEPASKPATPPRSGRVPTAPAHIDASMRTDQGNVGLSLDNGTSPCTVNSFVSLAQQGYFDDTQCHRLTTARTLAVLQCGDPVGSGVGGPGYEFTDEYPVNQYTTGDPEAAVPVVYPRGTLAMANAGPDTNGSQFFIIYRDSRLPPAYTVFGSVDESGLAVIDRIAAGGVADRSNDGEPATELKIESIRLD